MHFGKPVFLSRLTSLPEVGGDVAHYFDSFDGAAMRTVVEAGLAAHQQAGRAEALIQRARSFDWSRCATGVSGVVPAAAEPGGTRGVMLELPDVTLGCVDTREPVMALWAMRRTMGGIRFGDAVLFTESSRLSAAPDGIRVVDVRVETIEAYSQFMLRGLAQHIVTSHLLVVQWDGFATRPQRWQPDFLQWDYIGARWHDQPTERLGWQRRLLIALAALLNALHDPAIDISHPEDICICLHNRQRLERAARHSHRASRGGRSLRVRTTDAVAGDVRLPWTVQLSARTHGRKNCARC